MKYMKTFFGVIASALLISLSAHQVQAQSRSVTVSCNNTNFVVNFGDVTPPITATVSVSGPIKTCEVKPLSDNGWTKGKGCNFSFSKNGSLSGVHKGVFGGKLNCNGGSGSGGGEITWRGTAAFCSGGITDIQRVKRGMGRDAPFVLNCPRDQRIKSPDVGPPGSETAIDGCSIPGIATPSLVPWDSPNVIASAPQAGELRAGGEGPNSALPCDEHDVCYRKCGEDKDFCDRKLARGIVSQCNNYQQGWEEIAEQDDRGNIEMGATPEMLRIQCVESADTVFDAVQASAEKPYQNKQIERCSCCEKQ